MTLKETIVETSQLLQRCNDEEMLFIFVEIDTIAALMIRNKCNVFSDNSENSTIVIVF